MKSLYFKGKLIMFGDIIDFLGILNQFTGAEIRTSDRENYFLILND